MLSVDFKQHSNVDNIKCDGVRVCVVSTPQKQSIVVVEHKSPYKPCSRILYLQWDSSVVTCNQSSSKAPAFAWVGCDLAPFTSPEQTTVPVSPLLSVFSSKET